MITTTSPRRMAIAWCVSAIGVVGILLAGCFGSPSFERSDADDVVDDAKGDALADAVDARDVHDPGPDPAETVAPELPSGDADADVAAVDAGDPCAPELALCAEQRGVCQGARSTDCDPQTGWAPCEPADYFAHSVLFAATDEVRCDNLDNDCDGATDEADACDDCGDGQCTGAEDAETCPCDCSVCGDGVCSPCGESPTTCAEDCCRSLSGSVGCGDGTCLGFACGEDPTKCPDDCGSACGNGTCERGEDPAGCPEDCKFKECGNLVCEGGEGPETCPTDCCISPSGTSSCGDGWCIGAACGETADTCADDCAGACGDGDCDRGESAESCPVDCGVVCGNCRCDAAAGETFANCPIDCGACGDGFCNTQCENLREVEGATDPADPSTGRILCLADCCVATSDRDDDCDGVDDDCDGQTDEDECDDGDPCTADVCDAATGCRNIPRADGTPCLDGNLCNGRETCQAGICAAGTSLNCDDGNPCTVDTCDSRRGCQRQATAAGSPCDAGADACAGEGACVGLTCVAGAAIDCDDALPCTTDACDPGSGCTHMVTAGCLIDGACVAADASPPGDPCRVCDPARATDTWSAAADGTACDDGDACNGTETCAGGACTAGTPMACDDGDACNGAEGCAGGECTAGTPMACDDGNACNGAENCAAGECTAGTPVECPDNEPCDGTDRCVNGACEAGPPPICDDEDPCTTDTCADPGGCTNTPIDGCGCPAVPDLPAGCGGFGQLCCDCDVCHECKSCQEGTCLPDPTAADTPCDQGFGRCVEGNCEAIAPPSDVDPDHDGVCPDLSCAVNATDSCPTIWNPDNDVARCPAPSTDLQGRRPIFLRHVATEDGRSSERRTRELVTVPLVSGLVDDFVAGHWSLAGDATDGGLYARHGEVGGAVATDGPHGRPSSALRFDGADDHVTIPGTEDLLVGAEALTVMLWVRTRSGLPARGLQLFSKPYQHTAANPNESVALHIDAQGRPGAILATAVQLQHTSEARAADPLPAETWQHLALTYDGVTLRFFIGGIQRASMGDSGPVAASAERHPLTFGARTVRGGRDGFAPVDLADVVVAERAFSPDEVAAAALSGLPFGAPALFDTQPDFDDVRVVENSYVTEEHETPHELWGPRRHSNTPCPMASDDGTWADRDDLCGVAGYWPLADLSDRSGGGANGASLGAVAAPGRLVTRRGALSFSGDDDSVEIPDDGGLSGMVELTVEAWLFIDEAPPHTFSHGVIYKSGAVDRRSYAWTLVGSDGAARLGYHHNNTAGTGVASLPIGRWIHVAMTRVGGTLEFFVDGSSVARRTGTGDGAQTVSDTAGHGLYLGAPQLGISTWPSFRGRVDDLVIHSVVKSAAYLRRRAQPGTPMLRFWANTEATPQQTTGRYDWMLYDLFWGSGQVGSHEPVIVDHDGDGGFQRCWGLTSACVTGHALAPDEQPQFPTASWSFGGLTNARGGPLDLDGDEVSEDGDGSGVVGDAPCASREREGCDDNCPSEGNNDQVDEDGDGIGDACDPCPNGCAEDDNPCTVARCDERQGCVHVAVAVGTPCNDGAYCTIDDVCIDEVCVGSSDRVCLEGGDPTCLRDTCLEATDECVPSRNNGNFCDDANTGTTVESCSDGFCACTPRCAGRECGPDGCGGSCGTCLGDTGCAGDGSCTELPAGMPVPGGVVLVPAGTFQMGVEPGEVPRSSDESPRRPVEITRPYFALPTEITRADWAAHFDSPPGEGGECGLRCAAGGVSWHDALAYANARSRADGLPECFDLSTCSGTPGHDYACDEDAVEAAAGDPTDCLGWRLPTEAEWEFMARAGAGGMTWLGDIEHFECDGGGDLALGRVARTRCNSAADGDEVGGLEASPWGLFDVIGGQREWVWDRYDNSHYGDRVDALLGEPDVDPLGPTAQHLDRVVRNCSRATESLHDCRLAVRNWLPVDHRATDVGLRLVRTRPDPADPDDDGVATDGDGNGTPADNPCAGGATTSCDDNCPFAANPEQADRDRDGVGDACDDPSTCAEMTPCAARCASEADGEAAINACIEDCVRAGSVDARLQMHRLQRCIANECAPVPGDSFCPINAQNNACRPAGQACDGGLDCVPDCDGGPGTQDGCGHVCEGCDACVGILHCAADFTCHNAPNGVTPPPDFTLVPPGDFAMGAAPHDSLAQDDERPDRAVRISRPFWLKTTEVTAAEWRETLPQGTVPGEVEGCPTCPVSNLNWFGALAWCNARSEIEGLPPCYELDECNGVSPGGDLRCASVRVLAPGGDPTACAGYRLPTEAEWEWAYRAGTTEIIPGGNGTQGEGDCDALDLSADAVAWNVCNAGELKRPVGTRFDNPWRLHDMGGNVEELVWDTYDPGYYSERIAVIGTGADTDPGGASPSEAFADDQVVVRGGHFRTGAHAVRASRRTFNGRAGRNSFQGFRPARSLLSTADIDLDRDDVCAHPECSVPEADTCPTVWNPDNDPSACPVLGEGFAASRPIGLHAPDGRTATPERRTREVVEIPLRNGVYDDSLLGHWPLDDDATDASGQRRHGSEVGLNHVFGPLVDAVGDLTRAGLFDGAQTAVTIPGTESFAAGADALTAMAWVRVSDRPTSAKAVVGRRHRVADGDERDVFALAFADPFVEAVVTQDDGTVVRARAFSRFDEWVHLALVYGDGALTLYVDGALAVAPTGGPSRQVAAGPLWSSDGSAPVAIGHRLPVVGAPESHFRGLIDDVVVFARPLSAAEIAAYAHSRAPYADRSVAPGAQTDFDDLRVVEGDGALHTVPHEFIGPRVHSDTPCPMESDDGTWKDRDDLCGVAAYWRMDGGEAVVGPALVRTDLEPVAGRLGAAGGAQRFNGSSSDADTTGDIAVGTEAFTIEMWIWPLRVRDNGQIFLAAAHDTAHDDEAPAHTNAWELGFRKTGPTFAWDADKMSLSSHERVSSSSMPIGRWVHVAATRTADGTIRTWLDGVDVSGGSAVLGDPDAPLPTTRRTTLGLDPTSPATSSRRFEGLIDEVIIHAVAKSPDYLARRAQGGVPTLRFHASSSAVPDATGAYFVGPYALHWGDATATQVAPVVTASDATTRCHGLLSACLGTLAWWRFDDPARPRLDSSTAARPGGGVTDGVTSGPGVRGAGLALDGIDDSMNVALAVLGGVGDLTVEIAARWSITGPPNPTLLDTLNVGDDQDITMHLERSASELHLTVDGEEIVAPLAPLNSEVHTYAFSRRIGDVYALFQDGVLLATGLFAGGGNAVGILNWVIGAFADDDFVRPPDRYWEGDLDEVRVTARALFPDELQHFPPLRVGLGASTIEGCVSNADCAANEVCSKATGDCGGIGTCAVTSGVCNSVWDPVCGCNGETYDNAECAATARVSLRATGFCP